MISREYIIFNKKKKIAMVFRDKDKALDFLKNAPHDNFNAVVIRKR